MKDETKEILNWLNQIIKENKESDVSLNSCVIPFEILYKLQDYITNLQEENEIKDTNWESLKYYLEKLYLRDYIDGTISDDIDKKIKKLESKVEIKGYQKDIKHLQEEIERLKKELNTLKLSEEEWLDETLGGDEDE